MKKFLRLFIKLLLIVITLYILLVVSIYSLNPYIAKHQIEFEQTIANIIKQPLKVDKIRLGIYGLKPVIQFTNLEIVNPTSNLVQFQAKELDIGFDLFGSLINWQIEPGLVFIKSTNLDVVKNIDNTLIINGVTYSSQAQNQSLRNKLLWLISSGKIILKDVNFAFQKEAAEQIKVANLNFILSNKIFYRKLKMDGSWQQASSAPTTFAVSMRLHGSLLKHKPFSIYGDVWLSHFNIVFAEKLKENIDFLIPRQGKINCYLSQSNLTLDKLFRWPLSISEANSVIEWNKLDSSWYVKLTNTNIKNNELEIKSNAEVSIPTTSESPFLNLNAVFVGKNVENAKLYFPAKIMNPALVSWLDNAFIGGNQIKGKFIFKGKFSDFPFDNNTGTFLVDTYLQGIDFHYFKNWPIISGINGKMIFRGRGLEININKANIMNAPISNAKAVIPNLADAALDVKGTINSDSSMGLRFIAKSPLQNIIGGDFAGISLVGPMLLNLKLMIPLADQTSTIKILGDVTLKNNSLKLSAINLGLENLQGNVRFTSDEVVANNFSGELFSKPVAITIVTQKDSFNNKITQLDLSGKIALSDIEESLKIKLNNILTGETDYAAAFQFYPNNLKQYNNLHIASSLVGVNINLPEPFKKTASQKQNLLADLHFAASNPKLDFVYGNELKSSLTFDYLNNQLKISSGEVHFGEGDFLGFNGAGLFLSGNLDTVDLSVWNSYLQNVKPSALSSNVIRKIDLYIADLIAFGQELPSMKIQGSYSANALSLKVQSSQMSGSIMIPDNYPKSSLNCNFDRVYISSSEGSNTSKKTSIKPSSISSLNFSAKEFHYGAKNLGTVQIKTRPDDGNENSLIIKNLKIGTSDFTLESSGKWSVFGGQSQTLLNGKITSNDFGKALKSWDMTQSLANGTGSIQFYLRWPSTFFDPVLNGCSGNFSIMIKDGRIVNLGAKTNAEVGIGRVLNILGLQTLPRRLTLDFSDLVKEGYSFDVLQGTYKISDGSVYTGDTVLHGSVAEVNVTGRVGLRAKDFNMLMTVIPNITSSLPVIATVVGGPITGAVTWLADKVIISKGVGKVTSYVYKITGSWLNPNIQKL